MRALLKAREKRIEIEHRWQVLVAALPLQADPKEYMEQLLGISGSEGWHGDTVGSDVSAPPGTPLLHMITEQQASMMNLPITFVKVVEETPKVE